MDFLSLLKAASCVLPVLTGRRVFIQDSDRPATDLVPAYLTHRDVFSKPEPEIRKKVASAQKAAALPRAKGGPRDPLYIEGAEAGTPA
jgi:hypothetical protein